MVSNNLPYPRSSIGEADTRKCGAAAGRFTIEWTHLTGGQPGYEDDARNDGADPAKGA
ncbi:hypothetical protein HNQ75_003400 [Rhizobium flavum]|uniref:Uncharacterized protein n=1 Tax=Pseudorhizobium flavum TaxID=1335061 RepID=A0A7X0DDY1_9HYPH|nr:hypothetical protein [Pseudorhizobium flavum]MBB6181413.1 hypothetical protein [Pseudorhizobium flavum]